MFIDDTLLLIIPKGCTELFNQSLKIDSICLHLGKFTPLWKNI